MAYAKNLGRATAALLVLSGAVHVAMAAMLQRQVGVDALLPMSVFGVLFLVSGGVLLWRMQKWSCSFGIVSSAICMALIVIFMATGMMAAMLTSYPILAQYQMPMFILMVPVNIVIVALAAVALRSISK